MASRSVLSRNGLTPERFTPGAKITVDGDSARHKPTGCQFARRTSPMAACCESTDAVRPDARCGCRRCLPTAVDCRRLDDEALPRTARPSASDSGRRASARCVRSDQGRSRDQLRSRESGAVLDQRQRAVRDQARAESLVVDHRFMDSQRVMHLTERRPRAHRAGPWVIRRAVRGDALVVTTTTSSPEPSSRAAASCTPRPEVDRAARGHRRGRPRDHDDGRRSGVLRAAVHDQGALRSEPRDPEPYNCKPGYQQ